MGTIVLSPIQMDVKKMLNLIIENTKKTDILLNLTDTKCYIRIGIFQGGGYEIQLTNSSDKSMQSFKIGKCFGHHVFTKDFYQLPEAFFTDQDVIDITVRLSGFLNDYIKK